MIQRREFMIKSGLAAAAITALPAATFGTCLMNNKQGTDEAVRILMPWIDKLIPDFLGRQLDSPGHRWDGGVADIFEVPNVHTTKEFITTLGSAYISRFSKYYLSPKLEKPLERAAQCLVNIQHSDGTIDLHITNFHSSPDTAFIINDLCPTYACLKRLDSPALKQTVDSLATFIANTGKCFLTGGVHTANHRWVISSALAWLHHFFPSQEYVDRIDLWLSEGIDFDPDGQYSERSVGDYSPICDNMFTVIGRHLDRPEIQEYARKNLAMSMYYIQPGGEVLTDASGRQDSAYQAFVDQYYYAYRYYAIKDNNPAFTAVCKLIEEKLPEKIVRYVPFMLEDELFEKPLPAPTKVPDNYFKRFSYSGVIRIRRGNTDISVIENNPTFFSIIKGNAVMQSLRLGASFFGWRGQFISDNCEVKDGKIIMTKSKTRGYLQPIPLEGRTGGVTWDKESIAERVEDTLQKMDFRVIISETNGKVSMDIEIKGTDHVPVTMEMSFRAGGKLSGVTEDKFNENSYFLGDNMAEYKVGNDVIHIGPGCTSHKWTQLRGMSAKQNGKSVYLTGYTPFKHTLEIY